MNMVCEKCGCEDNPYGQKVCSNCGQELFYLGDEIEVVDNNDEGEEITDNKVIEDESIINKKLDNAKGLILFGVISFLLSMFMYTVSIFPYLVVISLGCSLTGFILYLINNEKKEEIIKFNYDKKREIFSGRYPILQEKAKNMYETIITQFQRSNNYINFNGYDYWVYNKQFCKIESIDTLFERISDESSSYFESIINGVDIDSVEIDYNVISIKDIKYFCKEGDVQYETQISGGGGGGPSIKGAIIGGIIAGEAGMIVGGRKKINEINSETITHDSRRTIFKYYYNGNLVSEEYPLEMFEVFEELIPEKEYNIVVHNNVTSTNTLSDIDHIKNRITKLEELYDSNMITEDEYKKKRKEILSDI